MRKRLLLFSTLFFFLFASSGFVDAQNSNKSDFYLENWKSKQYNVPEQTIQIELQNGESTSKIKIFPSDTVAPFLPTQLGLNTTFRSGSDMLYERLDNYKISNMGAFRYPAGSGSNIYFWDGNIPDKFLLDFNPIDGTKSSALKPNEFAVFIDSMKAQATVNVNYFYARYGITNEGTREARVNQAAEYAAGFVDYMNIQQKAGIKNWEIGNECYGKWEEGYNVNGSIVTGKEYGEDLCVFAEKMKAVDSTINIGAVMYPKSDEWNNQVMSEVKNHADFLIVHNYFTTEKDATAENILASTTQVTDIKKQMEDCVERNTSFQKNHFPVYMSEYNCRGPHTTTFINACFTADVIGKLIQNNYGLATRWVGEWKWSSGTHGLFALDDPDQADYSVRQAYPVYHYFGKCFGDYMIKTQCTNNNITVYGSTFSDGKTGLLVINSTGEKQQFNIEQDDAGKAFLYEIYANSVDEGDKKFWINGLTSTTPGGGPNNIPEINPYAFEYNKNTLFEVKKYSVTFYVFDTVLATAAKTIKKHIQKPIIYPVPVTNQLHFRATGSIDKIEIFNLFGQKVMASEFKNPLNIAYMPAGYYFINLYADNERFSQAFIKKNYMPF